MTTGFFHKKNAPLSVHPVVFAYRREKTNQGIRPSSKHAKIAQRPSRRVQTGLIPVSHSKCLHPMATTGMPQGRFPWAISHRRYRASLFLAENPQQDFDHPAKKLREFDGVKFHPYPSLPHLIDPAVHPPHLYICGRCRCVPRIWQEGKKGQPPMISIPAFDDEKHPRPECDLSLLGDQLIADTQGFLSLQNRFLERVTEAGEGHP